MIAMYYFFMFSNVWQDHLIVYIDHVCHFWFVLMSNNTDNPIAVTYLHLYFRLSCYHDEVLVLEHIRMNI